MTGWYMQKDYLCFSNPYRQLVSLEVDGKSVISYQETLARIKYKKNNDFSICRVLLMGLVALLVMLLIVPRLTMHQAREMRKKQSQET